VSGFVEHFDVDVVFLVHDRVATPPLPPGAESVRWMDAPLVDDVRTRALRRLVLERRPWALANRDWRETRAQVLEWLSPGGYDFVWFGAISHCLALSPYIEASHSAVDIDDVESSKWRGWLRRRPTLTEVPEYAQRLVELPMWRRAECQVSRHVDAMVLSAPEDVGHLRRSGITNTYVVPNTYPDPGRIHRRTAADPPVLGLVANYLHPPNREAARILATEVLPLFRRVSPRARVRLVGRGSEFISSLAAEPGVDLVGAVDDVRPHVADVLALVMPIRFGGGTRLKALEAFALGVPVISTRVGVAGLGVDDNDAYLNAEEPGEFAARAELLLRQPELEVELTDKARRHYERSFTLQASARAIAALTTQLRSG
jgi:glycosyltransferase involved in cell wall biosynthesis